MNTIFELSISQSKAGQHQAFLDEKQKFHQTLVNEDSMLNEGTFQPVFSMMTELDLNRISISMLEWASMDAFKETTMRLRPNLGAYTATFDSLNFVLLETADGKVFDLSSIKKEGLAVEFVIRKGKTTDAFGANRDALFEKFETFDSFLFGREFKIYAFNEQGILSLVENTQAVLTVWESPQQLQEAGPAIFGLKEFQTFAANIDIQTQYGTTPTV